MRSAVERFYEVTGSVVVEGVLGSLVAFEVEFECCLEAGIFVFNISCEFVESYAHLLLAGGVNTEYCMGGAGDGIAEVAAVDLAESDFVLKAEVVEEACEKFVGVSASEVDVATRVSAEAS